MWRVFNNFGTSTPGKQQPGGSVQDTKQPSRTAKKHAATASDLEGRRIEQTKKSAGIIGAGIEHDEHDTLVRMVLEDEAKQRRRREEAYQHEYQEASVHNLAMRLKLASENEHLFTQNQITQPMKRAEKLEEAAAAAGQAAGCGESSPMKPARAAAPTKQISKSAAQQEAGWIARTKRVMTSMASTIVRQDPKESDDTAAAVASSTSFVPAIPPPGPPPASGPPPARRASVLMLDFGHHGSTAAVQEQAGSASIAPSIMKRPHLQSGVGGNHEAPKPSFLQRYLSRFDSAAVKRDAASPSSKFNAVAPNPTGVEAYEEEESEVQVIPAQQLLLPVISPRTQQYAQYDLEVSVSVQEIGDPADKPPDGALATVPSAVLDIQPSRWEAGRGTGQGAHQGVPSWQAPSVPAQHGTGRQHDQALAGTQAAQPKPRQPQDASWRTALKQYLR